ncbi:MAG: hypothetical protein AABZ60_05020 [Planctomycetota bacterium]
MDSRIFHLWIACYLILTPLSAQESKGKELFIEVDNSLIFTRLPTVVSYSVALKSKIILRHSSGKIVPAAYRAKEKKLYWMEPFLPGKNRYTVVPSTLGEEPVLEWNLNHEKEKGTFTLDGKRIQRDSLSIENGLLRLQILNDLDLRSKLQIRSLKTAYHFLLSPLGMSQGCIEKAEQAEILNQEIAQGIESNKELFSIYSGIATQIVITEVNPFQKRIQVKCLSPGIKNSGQNLSLFSRTDYEILFTWGSPLIQISCFRTLKKTYYNHNGVNLNEIYIVQFPLKIQMLESETPQEITLPENVEYRLIDFKTMMSFEDSSGKTVLYQPDFLKLSGHDPIVAVIRDRMMTILSQSWHQGWKPIEQKPADYNDVFYLICDSGTFSNTLKEWLLELTTPVVVR